MDAHGALLSLDVFDTLLTRAYARPSDVFVEVAQALADAGLLSGPPAIWVARRQAAEAYLWRHASRNVTLEAIYARLAAQSGWSDEQSRQARAIEIDVESASHAPVPLLRPRLESWRRSGGRVAFVSDMYLPTWAMRHSLERHGWIAPGEALLVSSDCNATKAGGGLFAALMAATGVAARAITHIGDNQRADVVVPRRLGMRAEHFTAAALNRYEQRVATAAGLPAPAASLYAGCMRLARLDEREAAGSPDQVARQATIWRTGAGVAGPVLTAFALWILQRAGALGIRRLYFLARDGQILLRTANSLLSGRDDGFELRYLHASRQAWHPAAIVHLDESDFDWLFEGVGGPTLNQVAARLLLEPALLSGALGGEGARPPDPELPLQAAMLERLRAALSSTPLREVVLAQSRALRENAIGYLRQEGLLDDLPYAIVDIGWNGRLQRSLGKMLAAEKGVSVHTRGLYFGLWRKPRAHAGDHMEAFFHDPDTASAHLRPLCNGPLLEQFTEADHGTTIGYARVDAQWRPVLKEAHNVRALAWGLATQHEAVLAFARHVNAHLLPRCGAIPAPALRALCALLLEEFLFSPDPAQAEVYGAFEKTSAQEHGDQAELAPRIGRYTALRLALVGQGRFGLAGDPRVLWLPGSLTRCGLSWLNRWVRARGVIGCKLGT